MKKRTISLNEWKTAFNLNMKINPIECSQATKFGEHLPKLKCPSQERGL